MLDFGELLGEVDGELDEVLRELLGEGDGELGDELRLFGGG